MRKRIYLIITLMIGLLLVSLHVNANKVKNKNTNTNKIINKEFDISKLADYKSWPKVNEKPVKFALVNPALCAAPTINPNPELPLTPFDQGLHKDKFITVYVNEIGKAQMLSKRAPKFPVGTMIVKEKLTNINSTTPELLTVMLKREPGYDSANGDWHYLVLDGSAKTITAQGKIESCIECHRTRKENGYVFRNYLSLPAKSVAKVK